MSELTPVQAWRKPREEGVVFHFPSGNVARVRPVNTDTFLALGEVPDMLTGLVAKLIGGHASLETMKASEYSKSLHVLNIFVRTSFVWPRVVEKPEDIKDPVNEIALADICDEDKQTLFVFLGRPAQALESFRPITNESLERVVSSEGDESDTE